MDKLIFLIRHGQSEANANNGALSFGTIDPLTQKGQDQASYTGKIINSFWDQKSLLISSTLQRALQTTEIIKANINSNSTIKVIQSKNLIEKEEIETFDAVCTRLINCLKDIECGNPDYNRFFVITHGHVIQSVISKILECDPKKINTISNCGISVIENLNKVLCFNNILHLNKNLLD